MMKVVKVESKRIKINDLKVGSTFWYKGDLHMRISICESSYNAVNLNNGFLVSVDKYEKVFIVDTLTAVSVVNETLEIAVLESVGM